jgi:hypothetical protein
MGRIADHVACAGHRLSRRDQAGWLGAPKTIAPGVDFSRPPTRRWSNRRGRSRWPLRLIRRCRSKAAFNDEVMDAERVTASRTQERDRRRECRLQRQTASRPGCQVGGELVSDTASRAGSHSPRRAPASVRSTGSARMQAHFTMDMQP